MSNTSPGAHSRPRPEALLDEANREERRHGGRLKIFLGAAPGVGKTYTMLEAARLRAINGTDVAIGIAETHGRAETAEMMLGLELIPRRTVEYKGRTLQEMDLDAITARKPQLALVDELAHTNAPGSRHLKRYLDVEELLASGIDVYTTVNIQHLESLNDAVAQITGIRVRETIPDRILERADEVELVDISTEELLARLKEGKVYLPELATHAAQNYFRPGNLSALRQLALRTMAQRVDDQMQGYMQAHAIAGPWPTTERMLVSIGPSPLSPRLVRAARRMAERRRAEWMAVYVETPAHFRLGQADRERIAGTLRLAGELGGEAVTIPGQHVADDLLRYARSRNVTEIVIGKSQRSRLFELRHGSIVRELLRKGGNIDIYVIAGQEEETRPAAAAAPSRGWRERPAEYLVGIAAVAVAAIAAELLKSYLSLPNLSMVFLAAVLFSAARSGLRVSITVSVLSVLVYDFFLVPPHYTFTIASPQDVLALLVYLAVAILTSNLAGRIREQANAAQQREAATAALYSLSRELAGAAGTESVLGTIVTKVSQILDASAVVLLPEEGKLLERSAYPPGTRLDARECASAAWTWQHSREAGLGTDTLPGERWHYLPLKSGQGSIGVLALQPRLPEQPLSPEHHRFLESLADQAVVALERARLSTEIEQARLLSERERLQATLLSSISHDLRTPLASILGSATSLLEEGARYDEPTRRDLLSTVQEEAERLNRFVGNLLDTTRLESGALRLNLEWTEMGDLAGSALSRLARGLARYTVAVDIPPALPMVRLDFVLMEQALVNLLDNAAKYSPPGTTITIRSFQDERWLVTEVEDEGRGVPPEDLERIFDKFYRVEHGDRQSAGTGLGLSICRGIVEEHGGTITARSPAAMRGEEARGTIFTIRLPLPEKPPSLEQTEMNR